MEIVGERASVRIGSASFVHASVHTCEQLLSCVTVDGGGAAAAHHGQPAVILVGSVERCVERGVDRRSGDDDAAVSACHDVWRRWW